MSAIIFTFYAILLALPISAQTLASFDTYSITVAKNNSLLLHKYNDHPQLAFRQYDPPEACKASFYFGIPDRDVLSVFNVSSTEIGFTARLSESEAQALRSDKVDAKIIRIPNPPGPDVCAPYDPNALWYDEKPCLQAISSYSKFFMYLNPGAHCDVKYPWEFAERFGLKRYWEFETWCPNGPESFIIEGDLTHERANKLLHHPAFFAIHGDPYRWTEYSSMKLDPVLKAQLKSVVKFSNVFAASKPGTLSQHWRPNDPLGIVTPPPGWEKRLDPLPGGLEESPRESPSPANATSRKPGFLELHCEPYGTKGSSSLKPSTLETIPIIQPRTYYNPSLVPAS